MTGEVQYVITEDEWDENFDAVSGTLTTSS